MGSWIFLEIDTLKCELPLKNGELIENENTSITQFKNPNRNGMLSPDEIISTSANENDEKNFISKLILCAFCNFSCNSATEIFQHHSRQHQSKPQQLFYCNYCEYCHQLKNEVQNHSIRVHNKNFFVNTFDKNPAGKAFCDICFFICEILRRHLKIALCNLTSFDCKNQEISFHVTRFQGQKIQ